MRNLAILGIVEAGDVEIEFANLHPHRQLVIVTPCIAHRRLTCFPEQLEREGFTFFLLPFGQGGADKHLANRVSLFLRQHIERGLPDRPKHSAGVHRFKDLAHVVACMLIHEQRRARAMWTAEQIRANTLCSSMMCDAQMRHRSRWAHFLFEDMDRDPARREFLTNFLVQNGRYADNRPADVRRTTIAVRNFLKAGMRIMVDPNGELSEGGDVLKQAGESSDEQNAQRLQWIRVYFDTRRRWKTSAHIKRAVNMLGRPTADGWMVLEKAS